MVALCKCCFENRAKLQVLVKFKTDYSYQKIEEYVNASWCGDFCGTLRNYTKAPQLLTRTNAFNTYNRNLFI